MKSTETPMEFVARTTERWFVAVIDNNSHIKRHILDIVGALETQIAGKGPMKPEEDALIVGAVMLCKERNLRCDFYSKRLQFFLNQNNKLQNAVALHHIITQFSVCIEKGTRDALERIAKQANEVVGEKDIFDQAMQIFVSSIDEPRTAESVLVLMRALVHSIKKFVQEANFVANPVG